MAEQAQIDSLVESFNGSFLSVFFPQIESDAGQELLAAVAEYVIDCHPRFINNCPKIWDDFAIHKIALIILNWGITVDGENVIVQTPSTDNNVQVYLKSRKIGDKTCTFEQVKDSLNSGDSAAVSWRLKCEKLESLCDLACNDINEGGGSFYREGKVDHCGCDDR